MRFSSITAILSVCIICCCGYAVSDENARVLSFRELARLQESQDFDMDEVAADMRPFHNQYVRIRGFPYQAKDGRWILAAEPDLRTCCVGSSAKTLQQIVLTGEFEMMPGMEPVTVEGRFLVEPLRDAKGNLKQLFRLDGTRIYQEKGGMPYGTLGIIGVCVGSAAFLFWKGRRKISS